MIQQNISVMHSEVILNAVLHRFVCLLQHKNKITHNIMKFHLIAIIKNQDLVGTVKGQYFPLIDTL